MNSIRRARRRPRVGSISFKVFSWVLVREVAVRVLFNSALASGSRTPERASLVSVPTDALRRRVRLRLNFRPDRREWRW